MRTPSCSLEPVVQGRARVKERCRENRRLYSNAGVMSGTRSEETLHCPRRLHPRPSRCAPCLGPGPARHDRHPSGGISLPDHPLLPPVRGPARRRGDPVPAGAAGPAHGQCAPLHGQLGPEGAVLYHRAVPGSRQEQGRPALLRRVPLRLGQAGEGLPPAVPPAAVRPPLRPTQPLLEGLRQPPAHRSLTREEA
ncbi:collagen alpha-2(I) chain isoform X1 [Cebus imitator]|uniref:collagen alpha-2(I) chain isoform X1 n=1 Tax=Cebus imitator TaxID=2715852 RepID=UPI00189C2F93|nr:collagen alpha-2(I) chain isoform X1 [Cebus imitator]